MIENPESIDNINNRNGIGTLNEKSLHKQLIKYFSLPGDQFEVKLDGYFIDIVRDDQLIEVQTRNIFAIKNKLISLAKTYKIVLVHPLQKIKTIIRLDEDNQLLSKRKSPKHSKIEDIFRELFRCGELVSIPNINLVVPFIEFDEYWKNDGKGSWRRGKWSIVEKKLTSIGDIITFNPIGKLVELLPPTLPKTFTNKDISNHLQLNAKLSQKLSYTLRKGNLIKLIGKSGRSNLFQIS